jgi:hypothetical protein
MKKTGRKKTSSDAGAAALEALIEEITVDANGEDEQLWAFRQAFEDNFPLPAHGHVTGTAITVLAFDYDGNTLRGLTAKVRGADGKEHVIAAADVALTPELESARYLAAYRKWMGLPPLAAIQPKTSKAPVDTTGPIELVVLSVKQRAARCTMLSSNLDVTLRATGLWDVVPGEIANQARIRTIRLPIRSRKLTTCEMPATRAAPTDS